MKALFIIIGMIFTIQATATPELDRGQLSEDIVNKALANPKRYHFDDGGNIDFGNGFFKRRFNFAGQAQVCHENNIIYGGEGKKCLYYASKYKCKEYITHTLQTEMIGTKTVCTNEPGGEGNGSNQGGGSGNTGGNGDGGADSDNGGPDSDNGSFFRAECNETTEVTFKRGPEVKVRVYKKSGKYLGYTYLIIPPCNF